MNTSITDGEKIPFFVVNQMSQTLPLLLTVLVASVKASKIKIIFLSERGDNPQHNLYKNLKFLGDSIAQMNLTNVGAKGKYMELQDTKRKVSKRLIGRMANEIIQIIWNI